ncbi:MAG: E3 binding domain-containing protein [Pseudomonadota bacterium]
MQHPAASTRLGEQKASRTTDTAASSVLRISPAARAFAFHAGLDLSTVQGSGRQGRIVLRDVADADIHGASVTQARDFKLPPRRRLQPARLARPRIPPLAQANVAAHCRLDALMERRRVGGNNISFSALLVRALGRSMARVPGVNVRLVDDRLVSQPHCDVAVAVTTDTGDVEFIEVQDAHVRSLAEISTILRTAAPTPRPTDTSTPEFADKRHAVAMLANLGRGIVTEYDTPLAPGFSTVLSVPAWQTLLPSEAQNLSAQQMDLLGEQPTPTLAPVTVVRLGIGCDTRQMSGILAAKLLEALVTQLQNAGELFRD